MGLWVQQKLWKSTYTESLYWFVFYLAERKVIETAKDRQHALKGRPSSINFTKINRIHYLANEIL